MERNLTKNMRSGENIKHMRLRFGLTQKELGEKINVSERRIGTWERGAVLPSDENKQKLERIFYSGKFSEEDMLKLDPEHFMNTNRIVMVGLLLVILFGVAMYLGIKEMLGA